MKTCFRCHRSLPIGAFYPHKQMADGHLNKCRECTRRDVAQNRADKLEYYRAYDRARGSLPHRRARVKRQIAKERVLHPERQAARLMGWRKNPTRPDACQLCRGTGLRLERHHPDYAMPALIVWLCKPCHVKADRQRRQEDPS